MPSNHGWSMVQLQILLKCSCLRENMKYYIRKIWYLVKKGIRQCVNICIKIFELELFIKPTGNVISVYIKINVSSILVTIGSSSTHVVSFCSWEFHIISVYGYIFSFSGPEFFPQDSVWHLTSYDCFFSSFDDIPRHTYDITLSLIWQPILILIQSMWITVNC